MASSQDTEITLGTGKLLALFFGLVVVCAVFFALGYSLGRKSEPGISTASAASPHPTPSANKPGGTGAQAPSMTFYKAVEQKDANSELTPPAAKTGGTPTPAPGTAAANTAAQPGAAANPTDSLTTLPSAGYYVQVAAVSKQEDAGALVDALKNEEYAAFVATPSTDKLFRVQVGPFSDIKEAEAMRARLIHDGYNPILKK